MFYTRKTGLPTTNMVCFDANNCVSKYITPQEMLSDFSNVRMEYYHKRKTFMCEKILREKSALENKMRFLNLVLDDKLVVYRRKKAALVAELRKLKFPTMKQIQKLTLGQTEVDDDAEDLDGDDGDAETNGYNYLLGMPLWNLTYEKVEEMQKQLGEKTTEFDKLMQTTPESMWWTDLAAVEDALDDIDAAREKVAAKALAFQEKAKAKVAEQEAKLAELKAEKERQKAEADAAKKAELEKEAEEASAMQ